jgi:hypothetical protein
MTDETIDGNEGEVVDDETRIPRPERQPEGTPGPEDEPSERGEA